MLGIPCSLLYSQRVRRVQRLMRGDALQERTVDILDFDRRTGVPGNERVNQQ